jgi:hypothetical protein
MVESKHDIASIKRLSITLREQKLPSIRHSFFAGSFRICTDREQLPRNCKNILARPSCFARRAMRHRGLIINFKCRSLPSPFREARRLSRQRADAGCRTRQAFLATRVYLVRSNESRRNTSPGKYRILHDQSIPTCNSSLAVFARTFLVTSHNLPLRATCSAARVRTRA